MRRIERENTGRMEPGQDLIVAGFAGELGTRRIVGRIRDELLTRYSGAYLDQIFEERQIWPKQEREFFLKLGATEYEPAGEGGILTALWNLSGGYEMGIHFELRRIPVRQITIEVCEFCAVNPYRLMSGQCGVLTAPNGGRLAERLAEAGIAAQVIGRVTDGIKREVIVEDTLGYLERPREDELNRVFGQLTGEGDRDERENTGSDGEKQQD